MASTSLDLLKGRPAEKMGDDADHLPGAPWAFREALLMSSIRTS